MGFQMGQPNSLLFSVSDGWLRSRTRTCVLQENHFYTKKTTFRTSHLPQVTLTTFVGLHYIVSLSKTFFLSLVLCERPEHSRRN